MLLPRQALHASVCMRLAQKDYNATRIINPNGCFGDFMAQPRPVVSWSWIVDWLLVKGHVDGSPLEDISLLADPDKNLRLII